VYSLECLVGVIHMLVFPVSRYDGFCNFSKAEG
jgi:hypothetical protein